MTMIWNVLLIPHLCLYSQKDFQQDVGHSSDLDQRQSGGQGDEVTKAMPLTRGGGGLARVPNLRVCKHLSTRVAHAGREG